MTILTPEQSLLAELGRHLELQQARRKRRLVSGLAYSVGISLAIWLVLAWLLLRA